MEVQVLVQGPDTVHHIMVQVSGGDDPRRAFANALGAESPVFQVGDSTFRTDRVLAVVVRGGFGEAPAGGGY
jgi:predicted ABC-type transport system involved in lysophospholipase L1 biosynthesis ATPase subunit